MSKCKLFDHGAPNDPSRVNPLIMFFLLLPAGIWLANWIALSTIAGATAGLHVDNADVGSACFLVLFLPIAPTGLIIAIVHAVRKKNGWPAFFQGAVWNVLLFVVFSILFNRLAGKQ